MTKQQIFTAAHKLAKSLVNTTTSYRVALSISLKSIYSKVTMKAKKLTLKRVIQEIKNRNEWTKKKMYDGKEYEIAFYESIDCLIDSVAFYFKDFENVSINENNYSKTEIESRNSTYNFEELYWKALPTKK